MKRFVLIGSLSVLLSACGSEMESNSVSSSSVQEELQGPITDEFWEMIYTVPASWEKQISDAEQIFYYPEFGMLGVNYEAQKESLADPEERARFVDIYTAPLDNMTELDETEITVAGEPAYQYQFEGDMSGEKSRVTLVIFDYYEGVISFYLLEAEGQDYQAEFAETIDSIYLPGEWLADETPQELSFDGTTLVTEDFQITITDYEIIYPGDSGYEEIEAPRISFAFDLNIFESSETEYDSVKAWIRAFKIVQGDEENQLKSSLLKEPFQFVDVATKLQPGESISSFMVYELLDEELPVTLMALRDPYDREVYATYDYTILE